MKAQCKNCDHWKFVGSGTVTLPDGIAKGPKNDGSKVVEIGLCTLKPPVVHFVPRASNVLQGAYQLEKQRHYPETTSDEVCGEHPAVKLKTAATLIQIAIKAWITKLEYDPDKHHTNEGFSRIPTLDEAKALAGNMKGDGDAKNS